MITNNKSVFEYILTFKNYSLRHFWHLSWHRATSAWKPRSKIPEITRSCKLIYTDLLHHDVVPHGLVARIHGSHPWGPGSIPGAGTPFQSSFHCHWPAQNVVKLHFLSRLYVVYVPILLTLDFEPSSYYNRAGRNKKINFFLGRVGRCIRTYSIFLFVLLITCRGCRKV